MDYSDKDKLNNAKDLNQRVLSVQKGEQDINKLIYEYKPFIKSVAAKTTRKHVLDENDEMSIALLAFDEAIKSFNVDKGSFLAFSRLVISRRLTDYMRKQYKHSKEITYSELSGPQKRNYDNQHVEDSGMENPIIGEINALDGVLEKYGIAFEELIFVSPKAAKTKAACKKIIKFMVSDIKKVNEMGDRKLLPIKEICEKCSVPRKLVERHRKYIVTVIEILSGDYPYLREYVSYSKEVK